MAVFPGTQQKPNLHTCNELQRVLNSFTYRVNDGGLDSAVATVNITISSGNLPPIANVKNLVMAEDSIISITLTQGRIRRIAIDIFISFPTNTWEHLLEQSQT